MLYSVNTNLCLSLIARERIEVVEIVWLCTSATCIPNYLILSTHKHTHLFNQHPAFQCQAGSEKEPLRTSVSALTQYGQFVWRTRCGFLMCMTSNTVADIDHGRSGTSNSSECTVDAKPAECATYKFQLVADVTSAIRCRWQHQHVKFH